jgi:hypothetical protein
MAASRHDTNPEEVRRLFAELDATYRRAAEAAASADTGTGNHGKLIDEGDKAFAIIRRIREIDHL